jgi:hypothetical protein
MAFWTRQLSRATWEVLLDSIIRRGWTIDLPSVVEYTGQCDSTTLANFFATVPLERLERIHWHHRATEAEEVAWCASVDMTRAIAVTREERFPWDGNPLRDVLENTHFPRHIRELLARRLLTEPPGVYDRATQAHIASTRRTFREMIIRVIQELGTPPRGMSFSEILTAMGPYDVGDLRRVLREMEDSGTIHMTTGGGHYALGDGVV